PVPPTLHDLGITKIESHRWQRVAGLPEDVFEAEIAAGGEGGGLKTPARLKLAAHKGEQPRDEENPQPKRARPRASAESAPTGDFQSVLADLPDDSVDLVFTDPPYLSADLPIYGDLGAFAKRVLKPGGSLVCYAPTYNLMAVTDLVRPHLDFWTTLTIRHGG